nr:RNA-directed DNA polymerase, eukaryota, nucleotide-binding alpha-beta plait domain protein [Tanacetum cinerariifolium]
MDVFNYCHNSLRLSKKSTLSDKKIYIKKSTLSSKPTIILEVVASYDLWIWHAFFGTPSSCNDINVLHRSPLFDDILSGRAPNVSYTVNGRDYNMAYYLTDGIYPSWAAFVKSITSPQLRKHKLFAQQHEAVRKDVERAFRVLQARFAFLRQPCLVWDKEMMGKVMSACIIIHNMIVEDERDTYLQYYDPSEFLNSSTEVDEHAQFSMERIADLSQYMTNRAQLRNRETHNVLKNDLIEHTFKTLCFLNYALMTRHDYDLTSSLRRGALHRPTPDPTPLGNAGRRCDNAGQRRPRLCMTNFPEDFTARYFWKVCSDYGTVVDVFIPFKRSKSGKRFACVRFIKVINLERLVSNLCTIWIGRYHLHANYVRFERPQKPNSSIPRGPNHSTPKETNIENSKKFFVSVLKRRSQSHETHEITKPALVLDETCIKEFDFGMSLMGRAKDVSAIPNLPYIISKEGFQNVKLSYLGRIWVLFEFDSLASKEKFLNHFGIGSWFTELIQATSSFENDEMIVWISIEGLPIKAWTPNTFRKIASLWGEYVEWEEADLKSLSCKHLCLKTYMKVIINERQKVIIQGKVYGLQYGRWEGDTVIMDDFNEVRLEHERFGSTFNRQGANAFNNFISSACLIYLPLEGYAFT